MYGMSARLSKFFLFSVRCFNQGRILNPIIHLHPFSSARKLGIFLGQFFDLLFHSVSCVFFWEGGLLRFALEPSLEPTPWGGMSWFSAKVNYVFLGGGIKTRGGAWVDYVWWEVGGRLFSQISFWRGKAHGESFCVPECHKVMGPSPCLVAHLIARNMKEHPIWF